MEVLFVTGFSPIVRDRQASREFYVDALQLPLDHEEGEYIFTDTLPGVKHLGLWPLWGLALAVVAATIVRRRRPA